MSSSDVRSILNLPQAAGPSKLSQAPSRKALTVKRPDGISRELYALIGDNAPSLADAQASLSSVKYRERPKFNEKKSKWEWVGFTPSARGENPISLHHWVRVSDGDPEASVSHFGKFDSQGPSIMEYSQFEYDQHLADPDWTPHETSYLFQLLRAYDLRFIIAADRYDYRDPKKIDGITRRTVEEMKDRYYTICRRLVRTRTTSDVQSQQQFIQSYSFDKAREIKRKKYASDLFHLNSTEIAEEEALYIEIKRMEQNEKRYRADRDDLMRTVMGLDSGLVSVDQGNMEVVLGVDKNKKRKRPEDGEIYELPVLPVPKKAKESTAFDNLHCIFRINTSSNPNSSHLASKHPLHQPAGLRSARLPTPKPNAAIRITELLTELGINTQKLVMPTRSNVDELDGLLQAAAGLVDMKRQVDRVNQELRTLRAQQQGFVPPSEGSRKPRSESVNSTDTSMTGRKSRQA